MRSRVRVRLSRWAIVAISLFSVTGGGLPSQCYGQPSTSPERKPTPDKQIARGLQAWQSGLAPRLKALNKKKKLTDENTETTQPPSQLGNRSDPPVSNKLEGSRPNSGRLSDITVDTAPEKPQRPDTADVTPALPAVQAATFSVADYVPYALAFQPGTSLLTAIYLKPETLGGAEPVGPLATFTLGITREQEGATLRWETPVLSQNARAPVTLVFTPDGKYLLSLTDDGKVWLWSVKEKPGEGEGYLRGPQTLPPPAPMAFAQGITVVSHENDVVRCAVSYRSGEVYLHEIQVGTQGKETDLQKSVVPLFTSGGRDLRRITSIGSDLLFTLSPNPDKKPGGIVFCHDLKTKKTESLPYTGSLLWMGADSLGKPSLVSGDTTGLQVTRLLDRMPTNGYYTVTIAGSQSRAMPRTAEVLRQGQTDTNKAGRMTLAVGYENGQVRLWDAGGMKPEEVTVEKVKSKSVRKFLPVYALQEQKGFQAVTGSGNVKVYSLAFGQIPLSASDPRPVPVLTAAMSDKNLYVWSLPWLALPAKDGKSEEKKDTRSLDRGSKQPSSGMRIITPQTL